MNILQRSISSQANQSSSSKKVSNYGGDVRHTNTHLLFHMNDSHYSNNSEYNQQHTPKKPTKSGGFMSYHTPEPTPSFDYYNYFKSYDRLVSSTPSSPNAYTYAPRFNSAENENNRLDRKNDALRYQTNTDEYLYDKYHYSDLGLSNSSSSLAYLNKPSLTRRQMSSSSPNSPGPYFEGLSLNSPLTESLMYPLSASSGNQNSYNHEIPYRISFIETNIYIPLDLPSSPQHIPYRRNQQIIHNEWIHNTLAQLKQKFKPMINQILVNVEKKAKYPFIIYGFPGPSYNPNIGPVVPTGLSNTLSPELRIFDGLYDICASFTRPECINSDDLTRPLGYVISTFQTFPGEDSEKLEKSWLMWTGE